jgi:hypothetical protein
MATYKTIQDDIKKSHGRSVKPSWIAHVKELNGIPLKSSPGRNASTPRKHPCPDWAKPLIEEVMRQHGMLP